jgi:hypothetical protein
MNKARKVNLSFLEELRNETSPQMSQQISKRMKLAAQIDSYLMSKIYIDSKKIVYLNIKS